MPFVLYDMASYENKEFVVTARAATRKQAEGFVQWKQMVLKSNPGARIEIVRAGVSPAVLVSASEHFCMPRNLFAKLLGISPAVAERKIKAGTLLGHVETERLERIALVEDHAEKVFGSSDLARDWLTKKNTALGCNTPLSMLDTGIGASEVRKILFVIAYGGVA